ncbi:MAG TPA: DNA starvation/stationary phase protection protein [Allosphingosinicella sp.]|jgi:starvation-inducible DNA-binding protein
MEPTMSRAPTLSESREVARNEVVDLPRSLNLLLADIFALYFKTKSFHWHMSGPHFRDYHLLLDEQAAQIFEMTDVVAERVRKIGSATLRSIGEVHRLQRIADNDSPHVPPTAMLAELLEDNRALLGDLRETHALCARDGDVATQSLLEVFIDEGERRAWFLHEASRAST